MSLEAEFSHWDQQELNQYGKEVLNKYGLEACEAASALDDTNLGKDSRRSYKPQIRQVVSTLGDTNPDPEEVVEVIAGCDKKASTKNIMVVAMKKYYNTIGERDKAEEVYNLAKEQGIDEIDFNRGMEIDEWVTEDEVDRMMEHILPADGSIMNYIEAGGETYAISLEHKALVATLYYTGCRVGEVAKRHSNDWALAVEDIYPDTNQVEVYRLKKKGKGTKREMRVVPERLIEVLNEYQNEYNITEGHLFDFTTRTAQNRLQDIDGAYKFAFGEFKHCEKCTPHTLRHARVTAIANHSSLDDAGEYVSHSSTEITKSYRHLATEEQKEMLPEESQNGDGSEILDEAEGDLAELMNELDVNDIQELKEELSLLKQLKGAA